MCSSDLIRVKAPKAAFGIKGQRAGLRGGVAKARFSWPVQLVPQHWPQLGVARPLAPFHGAKVTPPALFIAGTRDSVVAISRASGGFAAGNSKRRMSLMGRPARLAR